MEIREAEIGDLPTMAKTGRYFHDISDYGKVMSYDEIGVQDNLLRFIEDEQMFLANAWEGEKMVGMIAGGVTRSFYDPNETMGQCVFVAVIPEAQQRKISKALMERFERWATENGASVLMYSGYSEKFIESMKRRGYVRGEVTMLKRVEE